MNINHESCWLCDGDETKTIGFIGDTSIRLGKDKNNKVAILTKYRAHESIAMYHPNFCPECGRDLTKDEEGKIITYGVISNGTFYAILEHDNYYSFWFVDEVPTDITLNGIKSFMKRNSLDGCSTSGTYEEIMNDLKEYITDLT